ncbi:MAG: glycosyltransferase family 39 protein [Myxococcales bacterium]|nr:glycosyltransferase family 39 protein [Myxococcales bacterium]
MGLGRRLVPIATALVFAWFVLAVCYGIAGPWQFGHNGFNGSAFCQGARNSLRFHIWAQSLYHTGLEPPPPQALYTHHPQMLHWHLLALFKVFSPSPFVGRLVPMLYSVATLVLLQRTAARYWGPVHALIAIAIYAFTPLHLIFGNMIDHEQGAIFWSLLLTWAFARWWEERRPRHLLLTLVAVSFAGQFDWPPYYIAFFLALFTFVQGLRVGRPLLRWRPEWTFVVVFSLVVLANFGGFFAWIARTRGGLGDMGSAYLQRTAAKEGYAGVQLRRLLDLHGILVMTVTALWVPLLVRRLRAGTARIRELIPGCFFAAQVLHSLLFRNAGAIHSYWTYWLGVASALGGADVVVSGYAAIVERARGRRLAPALVGLVLLGVGLQARYAYARLEWGFARGTASYLYPTPDIRTEVRAMQALHARYPRERTLFVFHSSMEVRSEVHWYHDTPLEDGPADPARRPPAPRRARGGAGGSAPARRAPRPAVAEPHPPDDGVRAPHRRDRGELLGGAPRGVRRGPAGRDLAPPLVLRPALAADALPARRSRGGARPARLGRAREHRSVRLRRREPPQLGLPPGPARRRPRGLGRPGRRPHPRAREVPQGRRLGGRGHPVLRRSRPAPAHGGLSHGQRGRRLHGGHQAVRRGPRAPLRPARRGGPRGDDAGRARDRRGPRHAGPDLVRVSVRRGGARCSRAGRRAG